MKKISLVQLASNPFVRIIFGVLETQFLMHFRSIIIKKVRFAHLIVLVYHIVNKRSWGALGDFIGP